jgi:hypothetical protein
VLMAPALHQNIEDIIVLVHGIVKLTKIPDSRRSSEAKDTSLGG